MRKTVEEQFLFDFYGELLSDKQKRVLEYYYNDDLSIAEIAELTGLTRQGVYDAYKRGKAQMRLYEDKLGLYARFVRQREGLARIADKLAVLAREDADKGNQTRAASLFDLVREARDLRDSY